MTRIGVALVFMLAAAAGAQRTPDCNLAARRFDNPISDHGGIVLRRYQWTIAYAGVSLAAYRALRIRFSPRTSAAVSTVGLGTLPHVRGLLMHRYPVSIDFAADLWTRSAPTWLVLGRSGNTWQSKFLAGSSYALGELVVMCYASP